MQKPTITLNGTSPKVLRDDYLSCVEALTNTIRVMSTHCPHGRDYPTNFAEAVSEHSQRILVLTQLHKELTELATHCQDEMEARSKPQ